MKFARRCKRVRLLVSLTMTIVCVLNACASPSMIVYTLDASSAGRSPSPIGQGATVIELKRAAIPDYLDSQEIVVRDGNVLRRSTQGRWATRLSGEATRYVTDLLAQRRPDAIVTDQAQTGSSAYLILLAINTLDVKANGEATIDADWQIVPRNLSRPAMRDRMRLNVTGQVATDQEVVALHQQLLERLAEKIDVMSLK